MANQNPICSVEGCRKKTSRRGWCEMHYTRWWRHGSVDALYQPEERRIHSQGYVMVYAPDHPLRRGYSTPRVYEHRLVFYEANGDGPFDCHWCGLQVTWDDMHVDHLNAVSDDNRLCNLVSSCGPCNQSRGADAMTKTCRKLRSKEITFRGVTKTRAEWAESLGIKSHALRWRLENGWPLERALTEGRGKTGPVAAPRARRVGPS